MTMTPKDQDNLVKEFTRLTEKAALRTFEEQNRSRIAEAPLSVRDTFDKHWNKVTGSSYYQPVTSVQPPLVTVGQNNTRRSDPRSRQYKTSIILDEVRWSLVLPKRIIGKKETDLWILHGKVNGVERPLFQNMTFERLIDVLGEEKAKKIRTAKTDEGSFEGPIEMLVEGYWEVQFAPKKDPNDPIDVRLMWEGQCLVIQRMIPVVLPGFYIEVADNATRDQFTQTPEDGRKKVGVLQEYPYTVLREATREEYIEQKAAGDQVARDKQAKEG